MQASATSPRPVGHQTDHQTDRHAVDRLRVAVLRLTRLIRQNAGGNVSPGQMAVLGALIRNGELTISEIAEAEHVQPPSASKIVTALEQNGYVERKVDPNDRRRTLITVSEEGHAYAESVRARGRSWLGERLDHLDDDDRDLIEQALPALERLMRDPS